MSTKYVQIPAPHCSEIQFKWSNSDMKVDLLVEINKYRMLVGVTIVLILATVSPRLGANGGPLHTEYLSVLPLWFTWYTHGRKAPFSCPISWSSLALSGLTGLVGPVLAVIAGVFSGVHSEMELGIIVWSVSPPCAWLPLCLSRDSRSCALALIAINYAIAIICAPLATLLVCGYITIPNVDGIIKIVALNATPYVLGIAVRKIAETRLRRDNRATERLPLTNRETEFDRNTAKRLEVAALVLIYIESCTLLRIAEGPMDISDVLGVVLLVVFWLLTTTVVSHLLLSRVCGLPNAVALMCLVCKTFTPDIWTS